MTDGSDQPAGWSAASLSELGEWRGGGTPSKSNKAFWEDGTVPWVSPKDMKRRFIEDSEDHITTDAVAKSAANLVPANSIAFVVRSGILDHTLPIAQLGVEATVNQDLRVLIPSPALLMM